MDTEDWLCGWRDIGKYLGKSSKTAQRWAREGMPFYRNPSGCPIAKPAMLDEYIRDLNETNFNDKIWRDKGIEAALNYDDEKQAEIKQAREEFEEKLVKAQRPVRGLY